VKIIICGSISAHKKMLEIKQALVYMGHSIDMPGLGNIKHELDLDGNSVESAHIKIRDDLIRGYYHKIENNDAVLVVNEDKKGITGYIGGNTFLEIGFGYVLNKKIFILNQFSREISYSDEINAMEPIVINGNLNKII